MTSAVTVAPGRSGVHTGVDSDEPVPVDGPVLLGEAARLLPVVAAGRLLGVDVHTALFEAAARLGVGRDRWHRLVLADETAAMFTTFLATAGEAPAGRRGLRRWLRDQNTTSTQRWLAAAAAFWRRELHEAATCPGRWRR